MTVPTRCVTDSTKSRATDIESSDTVAILFTFTAICILCWTSRLVFLFRITARVTKRGWEILQERTCGKRFLIATIHTRHPRQSLQVRKTMPKRHQAPTP